MTAKVVGALVAAEDGSLCWNCKKRPRRYAEGICFRCYQYRRRTGDLPRGELKVGYQDISIGLTPELRAEIEKAAAKADCSLTAWVRGACALALKIGADPKLRAAFGAALATTK